MIRFALMLGILISGVAQAQTTYSCDKSEDLVNGKNFRFVRCYADPTDKTTRMISMTIDPKAVPPAGVRIQKWTSFGEVQKSEDRQTTFLMNGPMYNPDGTPVGLIVSDGVMVGKLNPASSGNGNFFGVDNSSFENNGVIVLFKDGTSKFMVRSEARAFLDKPDQVKNIQMAFQGGPILVKDGVINAGLSKTSVNVKQRSSVCITKKGKIRFMATNFVPPKDVNGNQPDGGMSFYKFANGGIDSKCAIEQGGTNDPCVNTLYVDGSRGVVDADFPRGGLNSDAPDRKNVFVVKVSP
jgi:uncharacterized protein YigE (DUF2233 family)